MNKTLHLPISGRFSKWGSSIRWGLLAAASLLIIVLGGAACGGSQDLESAPQFSLTSYRLLPRLFLRDLQRPAR